MTDPVSTHTANGGPAFGHSDPTNGGDPGMSLRDYFAAQALPGVIGKNKPVGVVDWQADAAWMAYSMADAMLRARATEAP